MAEDLKVPHAVSVKFTCHGETCLSHLLSLAVRVVLTTGGESGDRGGRKRPVGIADLLRGVFSCWQKDGWVGHAFQFILGFPILTSI